MQPVTFALGAALYHDVRLAGDPRPIEVMLDGLFENTDRVSLFCVPRAPRKERVRVYKRGELLDRIRGDELVSFLVRTSDLPAPDALVVGFQLEEATAAAQGGYAGYRYRFDLAAGPEMLARRGLAAIVQPVVTLARAIAPRAGVVFTAGSASFAHALATGARGGLTPEQDLRVRDVFYAVHELGDKIRGPEWGTFLAAHHVVKLGGLERVVDACEIIERFEHGGAYLQITKQPPDPGDATFELARGRLAALLGAVGGA